MEYFFARTKSPFYLCFEQSNMKGKVPIEARDTIDVLGELHLYYLCVNSKECGQRHKIEDVHQSVEDILSKIQLSAQTVMLYHSMLKKLFEKNDYIRLDEITRTEKEIEKIKQRITNLQDQLMDGEISPNDFHPMKERIEKILIGLQLKLKNLKQTTSPFKTFINKEV